MIFCNMIANKSYIFGIPGISNIENKELLSINGGGPGDAAELVGRSWVWTTAHILTGGVSTLYLLHKHLR